MKHKQKFAYWVLSCWYTRVGSTTSQSPITSFCCMDHRNFITSPQELSMASEYWNIGYVSGIHVERNRVGNWFFPKPSVLLCEWTMEIQKLVLLLICMGVKMICTRHHLNSIDFDFIWIYATTLGVNFKQFLCQQSGRYFARYFQDIVFSNPSRYDFHCINYIFVTCVLW